MCDQVRGSSLVRDGGNKRLRRLMQSHVRVSQLGNDQADNILEPTVEMRLGQSEYEEVKDSSNQVQRCQLHLHELHQEAIFDQLAEVFPHGVGSRRVQRVRALGASPLLADLKQRDEVRPALSEYCEGELFSSPIGGTQQIAANTAKEVDDWLGKRLFKASVSVAGYLELLVIALVILLRKEYLLRGHVGKVGLRFPLLWCLWSLLQIRRWAPAAHERFCLSKRRLNSLKGLLLGFLRFSNGLSTNSLEGALLFCDPLGFLLLDTALSFCQSRRFPLKARYFLTVMLHVSLKRLVLPLQLLYFLVQLPCFPLLALVLGFILPLGISGRLHLLSVLLLPLKLPLCPRRGAQSLNRYDLFEPSSIEHAGDT
mmetsp:Transcript_39366/g.98475  ORF Transcript_39366/g.98475 Transcript_39366/m.98475 type:complete len:369 (+) Transcript_39366:662-1768(+)